MIHCLDDLESLLQGGAIEAEALASWHERFHAAMVTADRGSDWPSIVTRAHAMATRLGATASDLLKQQNLIREEMNLHRQGARALKGYKPS